jgi:hypothetical protein
MLDLIGQLDEVEQLPGGILKLPPVPGVSGSL